jgi:hypothetical protein
MRLLDTPTFQHTSFFISGIHANRAFASYGLSAIGKRFSEPNSIIKMPLATDQGILFAKAHQSQRTTANGNDKEPQASINS